MQFSTHPSARMGLCLFVRPMVLVPLFMFGLGASQAVDAKAPGARYCFVGVCHRVMTLAETRAVVGRPTMAVTSFYDDCRRDPYNPCGLTSSGEAFRPGETNSAASPIYPDGTIVLVRNPANGESAIVRINNAGPYWGNRTLDLARGAGIKLGLGRVGVARVEVTVLRAPTVQEARYRRNRVYQPMPGHVGRFASFDDAQVFAVAALGLPSVIDGAGVAVAKAEPRAVPNVSLKAGVAVAAADLRPVVVAPLVHPVADATPERQRLPANVVRLASIDAGASMVASVDIRSSTRATEIRGATLRVPPAGETTRVVLPRDFTMRGGIKSARKDHPSSSDANVAPPTIVVAPSLASAGERAWYRQAVAAVSDVVKFAPARTNEASSRLARLAALHDAAYVARADRHLATVMCVVPPPERERIARQGRPPGRARDNEYPALAA